MWFVKHPGRCISNYLKHGVALPYYEEYYLSLKYANKAKKEAGLPEKNIVVYKENPTIETRREELEKKYHIRKY